MMNDRIRGNGKTGEDQVGWSQVAICIQISTHAKFLCSSFCLYPFFSFFSRFRPLFASLAQKDENSANMFFTSTNPGVKIPGNCRTFRKIHGRGRTFSEFCMEKPSRNNSSERCSSPFQSPDSQDIFSVST
jgi:hypothetical protein